MNPKTNAARYLSRDELCARYGFSRAHSYRLQRDRGIPQPIRISARTVRWSLEELEAFEARAAADRAGTP